MKHFINEVGRGIAPSIQIAKKNIQKGHPMWSQWYGRYSLSKSSWQKMRLILQNGEYR